MHHRHRYAGTAVMLFMAAAVLFTGSTYAQKAVEGEGKKKKLYISTIKANGVDARLAARVKEGIRLAIFEEFGARYQVIDDDAIKVMYRQAEAIMSSGCDDTSCITQIADGINADEIVYGEVARDGAKIAASITCLERKGTSLGTKSIVRVSFLESQVDWIASETAKKLMNAAYKIDLAKAPEERAQMRLGGIELTPVKGLDIAVISFRSEDETVSKIIDYSKGLVAEGDRFYNEREYAKARARYGEVVEKVRTKLGKEKQAKMREYIDGIYKRIASTVLMEYKPKIEKIDAGIKGVKEPGEADLEKVLGKYGALEEEIRAIPYGETGEQVFTATADRKDGILLAIVAGYERSGDSAYRDYQFTEAMSYYNRGKERSAGIGNTARKAEAVGRFERKIEAAMKTGEGYLVNRVKSLVDQAEYYNFQDKTSNARAAMKDARKLIAEDMKVFATMEAVAPYNGMAEVMEIAGLTERELPEVFAIEKARIEQENFKRTGVYTIGMKGPGGGIIFYDKGKFSDGWRYLEAAPTDQSAGAPWGCANITFQNYDGREVGQGKRNTIAIVRNECARPGTAARLCADYRGGGKSDWFLPSSVELYWMYKNLHMNNIGSFTSDFYWSSSELLHEVGPITWFVDFSDGQTEFYTLKSWSFVNRGYTYRVRAIRAF